MQHLTRLAAVILAALLTLTCGAALAAGNIRILTAPTGSIVHTTGSAIASVISKNTDYTMLAAPMSGPQIYVPQVDGGRAEFALLNAADAHEAFSGGSGYRQAYKNLRLAAVGFTNELGVIVPADSDIKTGRDLKGRRVSGVFSAHKTCEQLASAQMANFGLSWDDVTVVPVTHSRTAVQALGDGRVDAALCVPLGQAIVQEINAQTPVRFISLNADAEAVKRTRDAFPAGQIRGYKAGDSVGLINDAYVWSYPFYLAANKDVPEDEVYTVVKTISDHIEDLRGISGVFKRWIPEQMIGTDITLPVHDGAKRFYQKAGLWNDNIQTANDALLRDAQ
ncbi:MAG: TAXI family TRAP transporter solute-binding subunit [Alcanivorax sp.]|nr:TAXI family TRAP transporter solute-binding subunit [Alcanivorax sp.]